MQEWLRNIACILARTVNADRYEEHPALRHQVTTLLSESPFEPEVALGACLRGCRDDRDEQRAVLDLPPDSLIPCVAPTQFAFVEPDLNAGCAQCIANLLCSLGILRGIAQERRPSRCARRLSRLCPHPRPLDLVRVAKECPEQPVSGNFR